ncbi:MAG: ATP-binding cassette domain-containing protein [Anaerolineae bacterium]|nr:ATP-binding cassette domain-containing protein [Anaerolineae bacterium]
MQVRDLWVDLDEFHLREINLDVAAGEYFVVLGPTGAGKTVLLETVAGLHQPRKGHIMLDGEDVTDAPPERRGIGFVYQDYVLFPHLNVAGNIAFGLKLRRMARETIEEQVTTISQLLGIDHLLHRKPGTLSGGEAQRVALARALVVEPRLLLLDEPLSALDPETREGLQRELARVHRELGTTTVHVTHDFEEAVALGDRIAVVNEGRVVQVGSPEEIFRRPGSEFVARFVGVRNIFRGEIRPGDDGYQMLCLDPSTGSGQAPATDSGQRGVEIAVVTNLVGPAHGSIRPEEIVVSREPLRSSARNSFRGRIVDITDRGTVVYVTVRVPPDFTCMITRRSLQEMELREGLEVYIAFKASAVHIF